jgi:Flp pilus assembly protein TadG
LSAAVLHRRPGSVAGALVSSRKALRAVRRSSRGIAAIEAAVIMPILMIVLVNAFDFGTYVYRRMELLNAAQMGVQAAWRTCDQSSLPATVNCASLTSAVIAAVQSTPLGAKVSLSGSPTEGYYCVNSTGALQWVSDVYNKPANCSAVGNSGVTPGDYIQVQVSYPYTPIFPKISVGNLLQTPMTATARMRLQ